MKTVTPLFMCVFYLLRQHKKIIYIKKKKIWIVEVIFFRYK